MLLHDQKIYWKQRAKIKGVKFGDENTKFFHTKASINHRHNKIAMLLNKDQVEVTDHDGKAAILWEAFKNRLGQSNGHSMHFDLNDLYENIVDPQIFIDLEKPFSHEEIEDVVNNLLAENPQGQMDLIMSLSKVVGILSRLMLLSLLWPFMLGM